LYHMKGQSF